MRSFEEFKQDCGRKKAQTAQKRRGGFLSSGTLLSSRVHLPDRRMTNDNQQARREYEPQFS
jgi:hypothetical protein